MKGFWQVFRGMLVALAALTLVIGGLSISLVEGRMAGNATPGSESPTSTATGTQNASPSQQPSFTPVKPSNTPQIASLTPTVPSPTGCSVPPGWTAYTVKAGDTLSALATRYHTSANILQQGNCLKDTNLTAGTTLFVPPSPTSTPVPCGAPAGWASIIIQPGDTLYHLSLAYGVSVAQLQSANCMGGSTTLVAGERFHVPPGPTRTFEGTIPGLTPPTDVPQYTLTDTPVIIITDTPLYPTPTYTDTPSP